MLCESEQILQLSDALGLEMRSGKSETKGVVPVGV